MLQSIFTLYIQGLLSASLLMLCVSLFLFLSKVRKMGDASMQERQEFLFDLLTINVMTIPILAFGMIAILLMVKA